MSSHRKVQTLSLVCVLVAASLAWGQVTFGTNVRAAPAGKTAPVLDVVPAGTLGFMVVPNIGKGLAAAEGYLKEIGVSELVFRGGPGDLLSMIKEAAQLGDGLNADGGFAVAMLDPQPFGIDFVKMLKEGRPGEAEKVQPPVVLFVPASGLKEVFGKYKMTAEGELTKIAFRAGEGYAVMLNGYAVLSPNDKAVQAVLSAKKSAASELSKDLLEAFAGADASVHVNMKAAGPLLLSFMDIAIAKVKEAPQAGPMPISPEQILSFYKELLTGLRGLSFTVQAGKAGLTLQEIVTPEPGSMLAEMMAAVRPGESAGLDRLPNLPYVLAVGALDGTTTPKQKETMEKFLKGILQGLGLPEETRAKIDKLVKDADGLVTSCQFVLGGGPEAGGLFGLSMVATCKDAAKVKALLGDEVDIANEIIKALAGDTPLADLKITYLKDAEKVDSVSVDAIEVTHPAIAKFGEEEKAAIQKLLGDAKIRFLVAAPDEKTVVMTIGGGTAMMSEALKLAKGGGTIPKDAGVAEAMKSMPANPQVVMVISAGNAMAVVQKAMEGLGLPAPPVLGAITAKTPLAIGAGVSGEAVRAVVFVPNDLVKEIVGLLLLHASGAEGGQRRPAPAPAGMRGGE